MTPDSSFWRLAYELCGLSLLERTEKQPLGSLPMPLRRAVLEEAVRLAPGIAEVRVDEVPLNRGIGRPRRVLRRWGISSGLLPQYLGLLPDLVVSHFDSVNQYVGAHGLGIPEGDGLHDEHYAERLFLSEAFVPAFQLQGLAYLKPQVRFTDSTGVRRRIDFVLQGARRYAIEVEGASFHADPEKFEDEKARQRELALHGFTYFPVAYSDIVEGRAKESLARLQRADELIGALASTTPEALSAPPELRRLLFDMPNQFPLLQAMWLDRLRSAISKGTPLLEVIEPGDGLPIGAVALLDTLAVLERTAGLAAVELQIPEVRLSVRSAAFRELSAFSSVWFSGSPLGSPDPDGPLGTVTISPTEDGDEKGLSDGGALLLGVYGVVEAIGAEALGVAAAGVQEQMQRSVPARPTAGSLQDDVLDYFARRFFPIPELKQQQIAVLRRTLAGQSSVAILPTGYGKSLIFQLYAILCGRPCIVVTPLVALMRDQVMSLHRLGIQWADSISSRDEKVEKDAKLKAFRAGALRLLYVSPERLRIKTFAQEVRDAANDLHLGAVVIDEVHCVSEWGHDFRPAYLQLPAFRAAHEAATGEGVPFLGLTATASRPVRRDICRTLGLEESAIVQLQSSDRANLSLSVHPVREGDKKVKSGVVSELVREAIPALLKLEPGALTKEVNGEYPHGGVVFAIYASPVGSTTRWEGVPEIADRVSRALGVTARTHSSRPPRRCPNCGSYRILRVYPKQGKALPPGKFRCDEPGCGAWFATPVSPPDWEATLDRNHEDFLANKFPLLVATKGFGMGIDKPNIRYVIHHSFSGGFEGYYQEAGRAGRDQKPAHLALVFKPPDSKCGDEHLKEGGGDPPCISDAEDFKYHRCKYGLKSLCDYGRQARFIKSAYDGVGSDVSLAMWLWGQLEAKGTPPGEKVRITSSQHGHNPDEDEDGEGFEDGQSRLELAAFRLQQLGAVSGFVVDYAPNPGKAGPSKKKLPLTQLEITTAELRPERVRENLRRLLVEANLSAGKDPVGFGSAVDAVVESLGGDPAPGEAGTFVERAVTAFYEQYVYALIPDMRKRMLVNQLRYAESTFCRRVTLRGYLDDALVPNTFQCKFCDVCSPALDFEGRERAEVPLQSAELEHIGAVLDETIRAARVESLLATARRIKEIGAEEGILARVTSLLEAEALPGAFYLAGALARTSRDRAETRWVSSSTASRRPFAADWAWMSSGCSREKRSRWTRRRRCRPLSRTRRPWSGSAASNGWPTRPPVRSVSRIE